MTRVSRITLGLDDADEAGNDGEPTSAPNDPGAEEKTNISFPEAELAVTRINFSAIIP